jgi:hypothetical protein
MYCDEKFTHGHQFKHKRTQLMVMEMGYDEPMTEGVVETSVDYFIDAESQAEDIQLSLHALT